MILLEGILWDNRMHIGLAAGTLLSYLIYKGISDIEEQSYIFPINAIIVAAVGSVVTSYDSVLIPLRRIKRRI